MKRTKAGVPAAEHGFVPGDGVGNRPFMQMPQGGHTDGVKKGRHARGGARARVKGAPTGDSALRLPVHHPTANIANAQVGQPNPNVAAAASSKPKRRGLGSAFYGEY